MPKVNPEILVWARETAGLGVEEAAAKVGLRQARGIEAGDRLAALERGEERPSRSLLGRMSKQYRRPLIAFYLPAPPSRGDRGEDFRAGSSELWDEEEPLLDALMRGVSARQSIIRSALEDDDDFTAPDFVGSASVMDGVAAVTDRVREILGFELDEFRSHRTIADAFASVRARVEASGVFVLLIGDLGSHHSAISPDTFRGYALSDAVAPMVVINDRDARSAWSFTLLHEVCHIVLGSSGVSGGFGESTVERFCNSVAGNLLLVDAELTELASVVTSGTAGLSSAISTFARAHNISRTMVAYRLFRTDAVSQAQWSTLQRDFRREWLVQRDLQRTKARETEGGPSYYIVRRHRVGPGLLKVVSGLVDSGTLTTVKAGTVLGVKPNNVPEMLQGLGSSRRSA